MALSASCDFVKEKSNLNRIINSVPVSVKTK